MTVATSTARIVYNGNGSTTAFSFPYYFLEDSHLEVIIQSSAGVETVQTITTHYTVSGAGEAAGGTVTMVTAPATGAKLIIQRNVPATQTTEFPPNDRLPAASLERAVDKLTMLVQQLAGGFGLSRVLTLFDGDTDGSGRYNANGNRIADMADGTDDDDAATVGQVEDLVAAVGGSGSGVSPVEYSGTGDGVTTVFTLGSTASWTVASDQFYEVYLDGLYQNSGNWNIGTSGSNRQITFSVAPPNGVTIDVRLTGYAQAADTGAATLRSDLASTADTAKGAALVGFKRHGDSGAAARTIYIKMLERVSPEDFGATGDGVADDTTALDAALATGKRVVLTSGKTYRVTTCTMSVNGTVLNIEGGATLVGDDETVSFVAVSGDNCAIVGEGAIEGPAVFDGSIARTTYACLWVTGDNALIDRVRFNNVPRCAIGIEDSVGHRVLGVRVDGGYPYASYNPATTTGHAFIFYNPPATSTTDLRGLVVSGCEVSRCIQGVLVANYDSSASETGVTIVGNTFNQCWDHAVYSTVGEGVVVTGNSFLNCKFPIVADGVGAVVCGNTLYANESSQTNGQQVISVREAQGAVISGNTLWGLGAAILCDIVTGTDIRDNIISNNVIHSTGSGIATSGIRLGSGAQVCENNIIEGNTISGGDFGEFVGAITLEMANTYTGQNNTVRNNTVKVSNKTYNIYFSAQNNCVVSGNIVESTMTSAGAYTAEMIVASSSTNSVVERNTVVYRTGGTNVTARGVKVNNTCTDIRVTDNRFLLTSGSLAGSDEIVDAGTDTYLARNQFDCTEPMSGSFTWTTTTASYTVNNDNIVASSRITVIPVDADAGVVIQTKGYYVVAGTGSFQIFTGDGTNTAADSDWRYYID